MVNWGRRSIFILLAASWVAIPAYGYFEVENFDLAPAGGFNNPFFNHVLGPDTFAGNGPESGFSNLDSISAEFSLFLFPGTDFVTFNLPDDAIVDYAEVWLRSSDDAPTFFEVIGVDRDEQPLHESLFSPPPGEWKFLSTRGMDFARIDEVRLTASKEALFDNLIVNVVPEPATAALLLVGAAAMLRSRRKRRLP